MPTPARRQHPKQAPAQLVGDLNAPRLVIRFGGMFPELTGLGEAFTVEATSRYLELSRKETIPNVEIAAFFQDLFSDANPDADLTAYPARLQWQSIQQLFFFRAGQVEVTAEIVRNEPIPLQRASSD